jgi:hypothetical protein
MRIHHQSSMSNVQGRLCPRSLLGCWHAQTLPKGIPCHTCLDFMTHQHLIISYSQSSAKRPRLLVHALWLYMHVFQDGRQGK